MICERIPKGKKSPGSRPGWVIRLLGQPKDSAPSKKKGPCWWFAQCATYEDVQAIVAASGNLSPSMLVLCLKDALLRAEHHKPSLVPYIALELDHAEAAHWEQRFLNHCDNEPLARKVWVRLEGAGLGNACKQLLWEYANSQQHFSEIQRGTEKLVRNIQAFVRAERQEQRRAGDPRAQMFRKRREKATRVLAQTPWPFRNPRIATFSDAVRAYPSHHWFEQRRIRALIERSGLSYLLAILRAGARKHGVDLSGNEIAALARCSTGSEIDAGAVRRYLRLPWIPNAEADYQTLFDSFIASAR